MYFPLSLNLFLPPPRKTSRGDSITNCLIVELCLDHFDFGIRDWILLYENYEQRTTKLEVPYKNKIRTNETEEKLLEPESLRSALESILAQHPGVTAFIRASSTENLVKLSVQGPDQAQVIAVLSQVEQAVRNNEDLNR